MDTLRQDLRYAARLLARSPLFTLVTALTLAIGIGGTTVAFSLVNALLLRPLPVADPERLVSLSVTGEQIRVGSVFSYPEYESYRDASRVFSDLAATGPGALGLGTGGPAEPVSGAFVTGNYFRMLGIRPALGRFLTPEDDRRGGETRVAVLGHELWRTRFAGDPSVVGRAVWLNGQEVRVVGVAPEGFEGTSLGTASDLWVPMAARHVLTPGMTDAPGMRLSWLEIVGRLAPGVSRERAQQQVGAAAAQLDQESRRPRGIRGAVLSRAGSAPPFMRSMAIGVLGLVMGAAGLVLLIASANVAGMLLARSAARRREIAIRLAMGAGRGRVIRQLVTESVMLALLGGLGGVAVAGWIAGLLRRFQPPVPMAGRFSLDVHPDGRVLLFALALSVASGVLFGLAPALQSVRPELVPALKDATPGAGRRSRLRDVFVVGQVALSLLLLLSAGLFVRALGRAVRVDPGFEPAGVIVGSLDLSPYGYTPESGAEFYRRLLERLRATPGVESASLAQLVPLTGTRMELGVRLPGRKEPESVIFNTVGEDYFRTMRMPLLQGRALGPQDRAGAPMALVVNEAFARQHFPGQDPLGQHVEMLEPGGQGSVAEVVGVVADSRWTGLQEPPTPVAYQALAQHYTPRVTVHVRTIGSPAGFAPTLRRVVQEMDAAVPVSRPEPLEQVVAIALLPQRLGAVVAGSFGLIGLLLAGIGLYGVMAFAVTQRTREIGIRTALGARAGDTLRLVLRHALGLVGAGVLIGLAAGMGATRLLSGLLFGVSPTDPVAFSGVIVLLLAVALVASLVPARRATRVDPMVALRAE